MELTDGWKEMVNYGITIEDRTPKEDIEKLGEKLGGAFAEFINWWFAKSDKIEAGNEYSFRLITNSKKLEKKE